MGSHAAKPKRTGGGGCHIHPMEANAVDATAVWKNTATAWGGEQ
jgi:hypothetical protein